MIDRVANFTNASDIFEKVKENVSKRNDIPEFPFGLTQLDEATNGIKRGKLTMIAARTSEGKCLGFGTKILMFNGEIKEVQNIKVGDLLMGVDSKPRKVMSVCTGEEEMFKVWQRRGITYEANRSHILSLVKTGDTKYKKIKGKIVSKEITKGEILNISINDYLEKSARFKHLYKGYKVGVEFPEKQHLIDPYFVGMWLGDGSSKGVAVTTSDKEISSYLEDFSKKHNLRFSKTDSNGTRCPTYAMYGEKGKNNNAVFNDLKRLNLIKNKHIPKEYLIDSEKNRLLLLAGLIDSDGYKNNAIGTIVFSNKNEKLCRDVKFLAESLGFSSKVSRFTSKAKCLKKPTDYFKVHIGGDTSRIPLLLERKKAGKPIKRNVLSHNIKVESIGIGKYYGFTLDQDGLFLLEDFTVTHNTAFSAQLAMNLADTGKRVAFISLEDDREQVIENMACNLMRIDNSDLQKGKAHLLDNPKIKDFFDNIPILVLDDYGYRFEEIKNVVETLDPKPDIVFIDYIQLAEKEKGLTRYETILEFARSCKVFSNHTNIGIVLNAQINRAGAREGRPSIHHISDCDKLEQYADMILLIHYPFVHGAPTFNYDGANEGFKIAPRNWIEVEVAKNKSGQRGVIIPLKFTGKHYLFEDWKVLA